MNSIVVFVFVYQFEIDINIIAIPIIVDSSRPDTAPAAQDGMIANL
jgi:hypothetical protein